MTDRRVRVLVILLALAACRAQSGPTALSEADISAIRALNDQVVEHERAGNWEGVASLLTPDAMLFPANRAPWQGGAALRAGIDSMQLKVAQLHASLAVIEGRGDLAFVRGNYHEVLTMGGSPAESEDSGTYLWILRKQADGRWLIAEWMGVSDRPLPAPPQR
jgi:uncharacterized protein (TIGR02246 family)